MKSSIEFEAVPEEPHTFELNLKICQECMVTLPYDYQYCPHCGNPLIKATAIAEVGGKR